MKSRAIKRFLWGILGLLEQLDPELIGLEEAEAVASVLADLALQQPDPVKAIEEAAAAMVAGVRQYVAVHPDEYPPQVKGD